MKQKTRTIAILMFALALATAAATTTTSQTRVGIFDSRAIALARFHCPDIENPARDLHRRMKEAQENGDEETIAELKRLGPLHQAHLHDLVFGSGSVNAYFEELKESFAAIAAEQHLDLIVSKWETAYLSENVTLVDITPKLLEFYHPDDKVQTMLDGMNGVEPIKDALFIED
ncbi:MAG: hypothetical protein JXA28_08750 [Bacteroidetes bacterium]|nr:hypothetical protein [Bacteroidota bacterium]